MSYRIINHTLKSGAYLHSQLRGVPPWGGVVELARAFYQNNFIKFLLRVITKFLLILGITAICNITNTSQLTAAKLCSTAKEDIGRQTKSLFGPFVANWSNMDQRATSQVLSTKYEDSNDTKDVSQKCTTRFARAIIEN